MSSAWRALASAMAESVNSGIPRPLGAPVTAQKPEKSGGALAPSLAWTGQMSVAAEASTANPTRCLTHSMKASDKSVSDYTVRPGRTKSKARANQ